MEQQNGEKEQSGTDEMSGSESAVQRLVMCSNPGCENRAKWMRESWIVGHQDQPVCDDHILEYRHLGLSTRKLST